MSKKDGSSSTNPWTLSSQGRAFPPKAKEKEKPHKGRSSFSSLGAKHLIIGGPPSSIKYEVPPPTTELYEGSAKTRIQYTHGKRTRRSEPLTPTELYHTSTRPVAEVPTAGHKCVLCAGVKSHPVSSQCGHSYCYVCIRMHLEQEWTCPYPDCNRLMYKAPVIDEVEEDGVAVDYPHRVDKKVVYTWDGLSFPYRKQPTYVSSSP
ncbi:hypothetical protein K438DRAFT_1810328 [Mycena galopus ATCC 62051]|nr:hypothetical protein K438DRAFT_1810328 [Mycena galopus ATCC 62051]